MEYQKIVSFSSERVLFAITSSIFLIVMHVPIPNLGGIIARQNEYIIWLLAGALVFTSAIKVLKEKLMLKPYLTLYVLLFVLGWIGSITFNEVRNLHYFLIRCIWLLFGFLLWISVVQFRLSRREIDFIFLLLYISAAIESVFAMIQFLGLSKYVPIAFPRSVEGAFQQKNLLASWLGLGVVVSLYLSTTQLLDGFKIAFQRLFYFFVSLLTATLIITESRLGLMGVLLGVLLMVTSGRLRKVKAERKLLFWVLCFVIGAFFGFLLLGAKYKLNFGEFALERLRFLVSPSHPSVTSRVMFYHTCIEMFKDKPLTGQGFSNLPSLFMYYQERVKSKNPLRYEGLGDSFTHHPHNEFFLILGESGLLEVLGIIVFAIGFYRFSKKIGLRRTLLYLSIMSPFFVHMMLEYPLHLSLTHWFTFILLSGIFSKHFATRLRLNVRETLIPKIVAFLTLCFITFSIITLKTAFAYNNLVKWYTGQIMGENPSFDLISPATENFYLRNWAMQIYMIQGADIALRDIDRNRELLFDFLEWSKLEKKRWPTISVFLTEVNVLYRMGIHFRDPELIGRALKSCNEGLRLYPDNVQLKRMKRVLELLSKLFEMRPIS